MLKDYFILFALCCSSLMTYGQFVQYPQTYNLKGQVDYIQCFTLVRNWNKDVFEEKINNTMFFNADNQPARILYSRHQNVKETNFEYEGGVLMRVISKNKDGDLFAKMEYYYEANVLKAGRLTSLQGAYRMNANYTYKYLKNDTLITQTEIAQNERKKEILVNGRLMSSEEETFLGEKYHHIFTYNDQGEVIKMQRVDEDGQIVKAFVHTYEYDKVGNYIQKVTVDETGDTVEVFVRSITYLGPKQVLQKREDYIGKWLLIIHHQKLKGGAFLIEFKEDSTLLCKDCPKSDLSDSGRWVIDLKNQRIKVWLEAFGLRVNYQIVDHNILQIQWDELHSSPIQSDQEAKATFLYKLN